MVRSTAEGGRGGGGVLGIVYYSVLCAPPVQRLHPWSIGYTPGPSAAPPVHRLHPRSIGCTPGPSATPPVQRLHPRSIGGTPGLYNTGQHRAHKARFNSVLGPDARGMSREGPGGGEGGGGVS